MCALARGSGGVTGSRPSGRGPVAVPESACTLLGFCWQAVWGRAVGVAQALRDWARGRSVRGCWAFSWTLAGSRVPSS